MATCISCNKRYYLSDTGCTLRFCTQECLRHYTAEHTGPGWAGDINEVFEERDRLKAENEQIIKHVEAWKVAAENAHKVFQYPELCQRGCIGERVLNGGCDCGFIQAEDAIRAARLLERGIVEPVLKTSDPNDIEGLRVERKALVANMEAAAHGADAFLGSSAYEMHLMTKCSLTRFDEQFPHIQGLGEPEPEEDQLKAQLEQEHRNGIVAALHEVEVWRDCFETGHTNWDAVQRAVVRIRELLRSDGDPQASQLIQELRMKIADLRMAVGFFSSVVKSGESWTHSCEKQLQEAMDDE